MVSQQPGTQDAQHKRPRKDALPIGTVLNERYQTVSYLGRGGMSNVYKALDTRTGRTVALKILHSELLQDETRVKRFWQEAKTYRNLRHRHIVKIYDFFTDDNDQHCLVMEYMEGKNLSETLDERGRLSVRRAIKIFSEICSALGYAHKQGVVHRDLKPSNIALVEKGGDVDYVKILDFGIAKLIPTDSDSKTQLGLTQTGEIVGSPLYMSPEQCMAKPIDHRSDIYSLGCLMYESLTGQPPLVGGNVYETFHLQTHERPKPLGEVRSEFKDGTQLESIILKCMAKNPKHRFQTMNQVTDELDRVGSFIPRGTVGKALHAWQEREIRKHAEKGRGIPPILVASLTALIILGCVYMFQDNLRRLVQPADHRYYHAVEEYHKAMYVPDYEAAERYSLEALKIAREERTEWLVPALENVIDLRRITGSLKEADTLRSRVEQIAAKREKVLDKNKKKLTESLDNLLEKDPENRDAIEDYCFQLSDLAANYMEEGLWSKATGVLKRTNRIAGEFLGEESLVVANLTDNLALIGMKNTSNENYDELEKELTNAIETRERNAGRGSAGLLATLEARSEVRRRMGKLEESQEDASRALSIARNAYRSTSVQAAVARCQLAHVLLSRNKAQSALTSATTALSSLDRLKDQADKKERARCLIIMGEAARRLERYGEAEKHLIEAQKILTPTSENILLADCLTCIADIYNSGAKTRKDPKKAKAYYNRALVLMLRSNAREEARVLYISEKLTGLYGRDMEKAVKLYEILEHVDKVTGKTNGVIEDRVMLGKLYRQNLKFKKAADSFENALALAQSTYGLDSQKTCEILGMLADTYIRKKDFRRSRSLIRRAVKLMRSDNMSGKLSREVKLQILSTYSRYLEQEGFDDELKEVQKELESI